MLPALGRLRHPLRRPTHFCRINEPSPTPRQLERQRERERQRASNRIENDMDDGRAGPRRPNSPDELPVIIDKGPYKGLVYPKEDLYYNSIMLASDVEPIYAGPPGSHLRQEVHRTSFLRLPATDGVHSTSRPVPSEHLTASQNTDNLKRWEEQASKNVEKRHVKTPTFRRFQLPKHPPSVPRVPSPPRGPIVPGSQEWDMFMDFPSENSMHIYRDRDSARAAGSDSVFTTTAPLRPVAVSKTPTLVVKGDTRCRPSTQEDAHPVSAQDQLPSNPPPTPLVESEEFEVLTWNTALNRILNSESVNPKMKAAVRERVQPHSTTDDSGYLDNHLTDAVDLGLVPNFSRPVAGSSFYGRDEKLFVEGPHYHETLENGVGAENHNLLVPGDHTTMDWPLTLRGGQDLRHSQLPNGVPAYHYLPSSSSDSSFGQPQPLPPDPVPNCIVNLPDNILMSSELDLHQEIVGGSALSQPPAFSASLPSSSTTSAVPLHDRLVRKLYSDVNGLQDRITSLEEDVVPNMIAWLAQKELLISQQNTKIANLDAEITPLKQTIDFSTKLLSGCWEREWELWSTLLDIQKQREAGRSSLFRIFSREKSIIVPDRHLLGDGIPKGYMARMSSSNRTAQGQLKPRELDAILLMAQQNVTILNQDMEDMAGQVKACQTGLEAIRETVPVPVSSRAV